MASKILLESGDFIDLEDGSGDILKEEDNLVPDAITCVTAVIAPTVSSTPITITAPVITSTCTAVTPTVRSSALTFTPDVITSTCTVETPSMLTGLVLTPNVPAVVTSVIPPSITVGAVTLSPGVAAVTTTVLAPSVLTGVVFRPAAVIVFARAFAPVVRKAALTIAMPVITSTGTVVEPSVQAAISLTSTIPTVITSVISPTVVGGSGAAGVTLTVPVITYRARVATPGISSDGTITLFPPLVACITSVIAPTVTQTLQVTAPAITCVTTVIPPTVVRGTATFLSHNEGRRQIVVDQQQGGTNYPFIYASDDLGELIGDLYLNYKDNNCEFSGPFSIKWLVGFGTQSATNPVGQPHEYDMLIVDADDVTVFDSRDATNFVTVSWGDGDGNYLKAVEWVDEDTGQILRVVVFTAWSDDGGTPREWPVYFAPEEAVLDPRTLERIPNFISSLAVVTDLTDESADTDIAAEQNIVLSGGYNGELRLLGAEDGVENLDGQPNTSHIEVNLSPGLGFGRFPCEETRYVKRINGAEPDANGNIILDATGGAPPTGLCYRIERPVFEGEDGPEVTKATLKIANDCGPCCDCDDFIAVYEAIRRLSDRYKELGLRAEAVRDQYRLNKQRWEAGAACRVGARIKVAAEPLAPCRIAMAVGLCNTTDGPLTDVELRICFDYGPDSTGLTATSSIVGCILCNTTTRKGNTLPGSTSGSHSKTYTLEGAWPRYSANFDCIQPGTVGTISLILDFPECSSSDVVEFVVTAHGVNTGGAVPFKTSVSLLDETDDTDCCVSESSLEGGDEDSLCG